MINRTYYFFAILLLPFTLAKAQPRQGDYVVTLKGDTITCTFRENIWGHVTYKAIAAAKFTIVDTADIAAYHLQKNDITYRAFVLPYSHTLTFVKELEQGKITLYLLIHNGYRTSTFYWYAKKDDQALVEIKNTRQLFGDNSKLKLNFSSLIADDQPALQLYTQQHNYSLKTLEAVIHLYNTGEILKS